MEPHQYATLLDDVIRIAHEAGQAILDVYSRQAFCVDQKDDGSPVTEADMAAHDAVVKGLKELTPDWPVLSEEGELPSFDERKQWQRYWLVDPLDGTREFIRHNGEFTVNIALIEQGVSVLGVIQVPVSGVCFYAQKGQDAYVDVPGKSAERISVRLWNGEKITVACSSRTRHMSVFKRFLEMFQGYELVTLGSSLKSCYVAQGRADIYARFGPTAEWDTAAAQCIVEAAGGALVDIASMQPLRYNSKDSILNPSFMTFGDVSHDWCAFLPKE
ncbi:3'(2'),5'-bisphosphate nucleotidase CysQ [Pseudomonadota bacterium]